MECQHTPCKSLTYYPNSKNHHYDLSLGVPRVLREARKNMPPPMQKPGVVKKQVDGADI